MFNDNWYGDSQIAQLQQLVRSVESMGAINVEIGAWEGKSTVGILKVSQKPLVVIDTWLGNVDESAEHPTVAMAMVRDVYATFIENTLSYQDRLIIHRMDWRQAVTFLELGIALGNTKIGLLHIDASHDYQSVCDTIQAFKPLMAKGGIMCGDDFMTANATRTDLNGGVERAVRECFGNEFQTLHNMWWATV